MFRRRFQIMALSLTGTIGTALPVTAGAGVVPMHGWSGITEILLRCTSDLPGVTPSALCNAALAEARRGSPVPVGKVGITPPARRDVAIVTVHASMLDRAPRIALAMERALPVDDAEGPHAAPPVPFPSGADGPAIALRAAFDRSLPWRQPPPGPRSRRR